MPSMQKQKDQKIIWKIFFVIYIVALIYLLLLKGNLRIFPEDYTGIHQGSFQEPGNFNLVPFATIRLFWSSFVQDKSIHALLNLVGNIVLLIPFGVFVPVITHQQKTFGITMLSGIALILLIELIQLITLWGILDIDDLILNSLGILIGWLLHFIFRKI